MCFPSTTTLKSYDRKFSNENCVFSLNNVNQEKAIYGSAVPDLQSKMTQLRPLTHGNIVNIPLPSVIAKYHLSIAMFMEFLFVNSLI